MDIIRNEENIPTNFEMTILPALLLYLYRPSFLGLFLILTLFAVAKGHIYKQKIKEYLQTLEPVPLDNTTPIARRRRRRGSE